MDLGLFARKGRTPSLCSEKARSSADQLASAGVLCVFRMDCAAVDPFSGWAVDPAGIVTVVSNRSTKYPNAMDGAHGEVLTQPLCAPRAIRRSRPIVGERKWNAHA